MVPFLDYVFSSVIERFEGTAYRSWGGMACPELFGVPRTATGRCADAVQRSNLQRLSNRHVRALSSR
ncbi:hypothetical protein [Nocardia anaemiae]|uniref:hypothetical protein n=1 Tax=Nocardia anaemiae TaxID=263910 RepID=UPI0007A51F57|nr:hypothetical protein [Nocardia anaemiae]